MEETPRIDRYYESLGRALDVYDSTSPGDRFDATSIPEYREWAGRVIPLLRDLIGLAEMRGCDLAPELLERTRIEEGILREKVVIQTEPGVFMPMYILIPDRCAGNPRAGVCLCPHGHLGAGKFSVAGRGDIPAVVAAIDRFGYDYGLQVARRGYVAVCPDARGFGERRERAMQGDSIESFMNGSCYQLSHIAESLGQTVVGMLVWDLMRLIDYLASRGEWGMGKIGCAGFSGGGMQTLWLAALDGRISAALVSGYLYGYRDSLLVLNGNCSCNYVPRLMRHVDMGDIGALIAPRPLVVQSCRLDHLNGERGLENVVEQMRTIRNAYELFGAGDELIHDVRPGDHRFHPEILGAFLRNLDS